MANCCVDVEWIQARIDATKLAIVSVETAILTLSTSNMASYSLDSGQTRQTVTRNQVGSLRLLLPQLEDRLQYLQNKLCGGAALNIRPGF
jgi:hypothetical protein